MTKLIFIVAVLSVTACTTTKEAIRDGKPIPKEQKQEIESAESAYEAPMESDADILMTLPEDTVYDDLEENFADVNKNQIKADLKSLSEQLETTETELDQARSVLNEMISKNQPAPMIEAQKQKIVVLEEQVLEISDDQMLKELEATLEQ